MIVSSPKKMSYFDAHICQKIQLFVILWISLGIYWRKKSLDKKNVFLKETGIFAFMTRAIFGIPEAYTEEIYGPPNWTDGQTVAGYAVSSE